MSDQLPSRTRSQKRTYNVYVMTEIIPVSEVGRCLEESQCGEGSRLVALTFCFL